MPMWHPQGSPKELCHCQRLWVCHWVIWHALWTHFYSPLWILLVEKRHQVNEDSVKFNLALLDFKAFISSSVDPISRKIMFGVNSIHSVSRLRSRSLCSVRCGRDFRVMDPFRYTKAPRSRSLKPLDFPDLLGKVEDGQNHPQTRKKKQKVTLVNCRICPWKCISSFFSFCF